MNARLTLVLSGAALLVLGACSHQAPAPAQAPVTSSPSVAAVPLGKKSLDYETLARRLPGKDADTIVIVGIAKNISDKPIEMCCCFDFKGNFVPGLECPKGTRPPTQYLLGRATLDDTPLECRPVTLRPNGTFRDSTSFQVARGEFARCPGSMRVTLSFWTGKPGQTFAEAQCVASEAVGASISLP